MICVCGWWLALFPCQVRVKRKQLAVRAAVGSCRCCTHRTTAACEGILGPELRIDRDQPRRGDPYRGACRCIMHSTCRCVIFFFFISPCLRRFLELDGFFEVSISADGLYLRSSNQESGTASCFIYKQ
jgi:hypothetical protein